jgi:hypothetical protein
MQTWGRLERGGLGDKRWLELKRRLDRKVSDSVEEEREGDEMGWRRYIVEEMVGVTVSPLDDSTFLMIAFA